MSLDTEELYKQFDPEDIGYGIEHLPEQVRIAWHDTRDLTFPKSYADISQIVISGMGGSILGPHVLKTAFADRLAVPLELVSDYTLPGFVSKETLVILSSFSGSTEETLSVAAEAKAARAKIVVLCTGGPLAELAEEEGWPLYVFEPGDLAKQPRYGIGFSLIGIMGILERIGLLKIKEAEVLSMMAAMGEVLDNCAADVPSEENPAKEVAREIVGRSLIIMGAEHLSGNAHILQNQINESAKQFANYHLFPEINHHLLEGMTFPVGQAANTTVIMLYSEHYHERTKKRCAITADILESKGVSVIEYAAKGERRLDEVGEVLQFGSYVGLYLALLNGVITTDIATVEETKRRMQR